MSYAAKMIWTVSTPLVMSLGIIGNIMMLIVLLHRRTKKSPTTVFLTVIACSDLLTLITITPRWTLIYLFRIDIRHFGNFMCKLHWFLSYVAPNISVWNLVAVTIERLVVTVLPYKAKQYFTNQRAIKVSVGIIVILSLIHTHIMYGFSLKELSIPAQSNNEINPTIVGCNDTESGLNITCSPTVSNVSNPHSAISVKVCWIFNVGYLDFYNTIQSVLMLAIYLICPVTVFVVCGVIVVLKVANSMRKSRTSKNKSDAPKKNMSSQVTVTVLLINTAFIVCTTPLQVFIAGLKNWVDPVKGMTPLQEVAWAIANQMFYINHAINFLLYFMTGQKFRKQWLNIFICKSKEKDSANTNDSKASSE